MITSLNNTIDDNQLDVFMQELEDRNEMLCIGNACAGAANPCVGQACAGGCIGVTICLLGAHFN